MADEIEREPIQGSNGLSEAEMISRRDVLRGLRKWSQAVIGGIALGSLVPTSEASAWINSRGGNGGGGGGWANRGASWVNGGGKWLNSGSNWANRGGTWLNGGGGWANRSGGGWLNGKGGGGGWINSRG